MLARRVELALGADGELEDRVIGQLRRIFGVRFTARDLWSDGRAESSAGVERPFARAYGMAGARKFVGDVVSVATGALPR